MRCALLTLFFCFGARASTVVVSWSSDRIVLAADGLAIDSGIRSNACKIVQAEQCIIGMVGLLKKRQTSFDLAELARKACEMGKTLREKVDIFETSARAALTVAMEYERTYQRAEYENTYLGKAAIEVVFAAVENGKPNIIGEKMMVRADTIEPTRTYMEVGVPGGGAMLGESDAIQKFITDNASWKDQLKFDEIPRRLIEIEIAAKPDKVGPPITIIEITRSGTRWVELGSCQPLTH